MQQTVSKPFRTLVSKMEKILLRGKLQLMLIQTTSPMAPAGFIVTPVNSASKSLSTFHFLKPYPANLSSLINSFGADRLGRFVFTISQTATICPHQRLTLHFWLAHQDLDLDDSCSMQVCMASQCHIFNVVGTQGTYVHYSFWGRCRMKHDNDNFSGRKWG